MKPQSTHQAFAEMINLRAIHHELQVTDGAARYWRKKVNDNPDDPAKWGISIDLMEQLLTKFGYTVIQEKLWKK